MRWMAAALAFSSALPGAARAFNENGYHSGMTLDEVRRSVAPRGTRLDLPTGSDEKGIQEFKEVAGPPGNLTFYGGFGFCRGKLFFYSETFPNSEFSTFLRLAERRTFELGPAQYGARSTETRVGPSYSFELGWFGSQTTERLSISQFNHQSVDVNHSFRDAATVCD